MSRAIRTAVFPVAGRGTRFLPATKSTPKEMLPIVDKPLIQYAVEEAIAAGATRMVFVTGRSKTTIEDHFTADPELEDALSGPGKEDLLQSVTGITPPGVTCDYVIQEQPLGLGHAVLCARETVGDDAFFVHLCDDLIAGDPPCLKQMVEVYDRQGGSVVAVETVPSEKTSSYGIVAIDEASNKITEIVEKPAPEHAPSNLAVVGRYLLVPAIFDKLESTGRGAGGEIQLTDAIADLLNESPVYAYPFSGTRYDCGNKLGYLQASVAYGLAQGDIREPFESFLRGLLCND